MPKTYIYVEFRHSLYQMDKGLLFLYDELCFDKNLNRNKQR